MFLSSTKRLFIGATTVSTCVYLYNKTIYGSKYSCSRNRTDTIFHLSSPTRNVYKMSKKEHQDCLNVIKLVNSLKNEGSVNSSDGDTEESVTTLPFLENSKWEKLNENNPTLWRRKCFNENTYAYLSYCKHKFSIDKYFHFMVDLGGRDTWDTSTKSVTIVDGGENNVEEPITYHWEVFSPSWPIANREYVCSRKIKKVYDRSEEKNRTNLLKYVTMKSDAVDHQQYPIKNDVVRVELYHSYTTLKQINANECESYLLIVEDQKINLPTSIISYVTSTAIPKFMKEMDKQCEIYHSNKKKRRSK